MSLSDEQFREQLVDYLYGELEGASLQAFEAALAEPGRRAELEAMRETLRAARGGLAALSEEPPAGARAAILAAERAPARVVRGPWLRRLHAGVVVPALAAAAALAFAVLSPRRDHVPGENFETQAEQAPSAEPAPSSPAPVEQPADDRAKEESRDEAEQAASKGAPAASESKRAAPARRRATAEGSSGGGRGYAAPPPEWEDLRNEDRGGIGAVREAEPQAERKAQRVEKARAQLAADKAPSEARASGPSPASAPAPVSTSAPASARASAPLRAPAKPAPAKKDAIAAEQAAEVPASAPAGAVADGTSAPNALVEKAREHANARRWADAAIAYRELLQRYPHDSRAASWRSELGRVARELSAVPLVP